MITMLHTLGHGGIVWNNTLSGVNYDIAWMLEIASFCAVNCYAMASGYVGIHSKVKYYKLVILWLQIVFSGVVIVFFFSLYRPDLVNIDSWLNAVFPIYRSQYWYMTAYVGLFFFLPVMNVGINALTSQQRKTLFYCILLFLVFIPFLLQKDFFWVIRGYSLIWLMICYILGTVLSKEKLFMRSPKTLLFSIYIISVWLTFYLKNYQNIYWVEYHSPSIVICSISLVVLFTKIQLQSERLINAIKYIASLTLGIYIFHEQPLIRELYIRGQSIGYLSLDTLRFIWAILVMAVTIFICGALFDMCRKWLFDKLNIATRLATLPYLG